MRASERGTDGHGHPRRALVGRLGLFAIVLGVVSCRRTGEESPPSPPVFLRGFAVALGSLLASRSKNRGVCRRTVSDFAPGRRGLPVRDEVVGIAGRGGPSVAPTRERK